MPNLTRNFPSPTGSACGGGIQGGGFPLEISKIKNLDPYPSPLLLEREAPTYLTRFTNTSSGLTGFLIIPSFRANFMNLSHFS